MSKMLRRSEDDQDSAGREKELSWNRTKVTAFSLFATQSPRSGQPIRCRTLEELDVVQASDNAVSLSALFVDKDRCEILELSAPKDIPRWLKRGTSPSHYQVSASILVLMSMRLEGDSRYPVPHWPCLTCEGPLPQRTNGLRYPRALELLPRSNYFEGGSAAARAYSGPFGSHGELDGTSSPLTSNVSFCWRLLVIHLQSSPAVEK